MNKPHDQDPLLMDHEADGIRELDNNLPSWWVWLFYLTTIFAVIYLLYFHVLGKGDLMAAEYVKEMDIGNAIKSVAITKFTGDIATLEPSKEPAAITHGKQLFVKNCAPCHRDDAGGLVGPNLTDDYWIHGPQFADNLKTIWNGVPEKGMIAWKDQGMKPAEIIDVASYIYTLRGTKPPNPKLPENQQTKTVNEFE